MLFPFRIATEAGTSVAVGWLIIVLAVGGRALSLRSRYHVMKSEAGKARYGLLKRCPRLEMKQRADFHMS